MDKKSLNIKKLAAGSVMVALSGFVPEITDNEARANSTNVPVDVQVVAAIALSNPQTLDFGVITAAGAGTYTLADDGTPSLSGIGIATSGSAGSIDITGATGTVRISVGAAATLDTGNLSINRLTFGPNTGPFTAVRQIAASATATVAYTSAGTIDVGGRLQTSGTPTIADYSAAGANIPVTIIRVP